MSLICPKCGTENKNDAAFCSSCGEVLDKERDFKKYDSIGGWLILLAIGLVFLPLRIISEIANVNKVLENRELLSAFPKLETYLHNSTIVNYLLLAFSIYILYVFFKKQALFPKLFIGYLVLGIVTTVVDASIASSIFGKEIDISVDILKEIFTSILGAAIWIPYMLMSKRVKGTFIQ